MDYVFKGRSDKEFEDLIAQLGQEGKHEDAKKVQHLFDAWKRRRPEGERRVENWQPPRDMHHLGDGDGEPSA